jgi:hypothetical protein
MFIIHHFLSTNKYLGENELSKLPADKDSDSTKKTTKGAEIIFEKYYLVTP